VSHARIIIKAAARGEHCVADNLTLQGKIALRAVGEVSELRSAQ